MANYVNFHSQLASIMEVLANAAVAEICQLVDDGFATLRLEISRTQRENLALKSKLRLLEVRSGERCAKRAPVPSLVVTCARKDHHVGEEGSTSAKRNGKSTLLGNTGSQLSGPVGVAEPPVEPEAVVIKEERLEDELTGCGVPEDHQSSSIGLGSRSLPAESDRPPTADASPNTEAAEASRISLSGRYETEDFAEPETRQQREEEEEEEEEEEGEE
ncbi:uncharacterized protein, partial [Centroberyx affinis]|uniref:uncharacterized protein n=1 Tax=Centroberyx affinis TaxID=166261 RepID=UPI003A5C279F